MVGDGIKKRARIKIQPRFKIQYPMKNRCKHKHIHLRFIYPNMGIFHIKKPSSKEEGLNK